MNASLHYTATAAFLVLIASLTPAHIALGTTRPATARRYTIPGTQQTECYDLSRVISCPKTGQPFHGQDGSYADPAFRYRDNGDGTVTDENTGLMWMRAVVEKTSWAQANAGATQLSTGGFRDWRIPTIKELYSLIRFDGRFGASAAQSRPFITRSVFEFAYGNEGGIAGQPGRRFFDVQLWSSTVYVGRTMNQDETVFGVNFADGRIKGYPLYEPGSRARVPSKMNVRYVRGAAYGDGVLVNNGDGSVTDTSAGLVWQATDDGKTRNWPNALAYCEQLQLAGRADWRLPNVKELQSIVDYTHSPQTSGSAALMQPLRASNPESYFWSSTTLIDNPDREQYTRAAYIAFGRAVGWMEMPPGSGNKRLIDVHGAGAQRSDPKAGDARQFPFGFGPQGDDVRILNYARCVTTQAP